MKFPKPWYRKSRRAWFVTLDGQQIKLGTTKDEALRRYHDLMAQPAKRVVPSGSLLAIIDAFLDWCQKHRAPDTYEWYRSRLELFAQKHPDLRAADLRPFHVQQWIDAMDVSSGTKRNYCRAVKRCMRWAKKQGHIDAESDRRPGAAQGRQAGSGRPAGGIRRTAVADRDRQFPRPARSSPGRPAAGRRNRFAWKPGTSTWPISAGCSRNRKPRPTCRGSST